MTKKISAAIAVFIASSSLSLAQTNLQTLYDFGKDRKHVTTTLEMFKSDNWGNTFFFIDYDYNTSMKTDSPTGSYFEIARCFNFWQNSKLKDFSLQLEYNGGLGIIGLPPVVAGYGINDAFLGGVDYFLHSKDYSSTLNLKFLYKQFRGISSDVPLQFTAVWGVNDIFGLNGLSFLGFVDVWCEGSTCIIFSEPQIWYNVGKFFGCENLNLGGEVELSNNFAGRDGFMCNPCLGFKWVF